ncbi:MAG: HAD family phosphatase [Candidatus Paceibacterota bacterium]|jgi:putative hydrolase of the HAD superfamily
MNRRIRGVAVDFEGPVIDFEKDGHHLAHRMAAKEAGIELTVQEAVDLIPNLSGGPGKLIAEQIFDLMKRRGITPQLNAEQILTRSSMHFKQFVQQIASGERQIAPRPGFLNSLKRLREAELKVTIGSSTLSEEFWIYWKAIGFDEYFDGNQIVLADEGSRIRHKPEPDIFLETARRMEIDPAEQVVIEDSLRGLAAGVAAKSPVVGMTVYDCPSAIIPLYQTGAYRVFCSWLEVDILAVIDSLNNRGR